MYTTPSSPPIRRLSASSLLEERCLMGYQIPIDPRYRDTRPIARSASSLYNMSKEVSLSTHNLTNTQGGGMMFHTMMQDIPQQQQQPEQFIPIRSRARSISNTNITNTPPPSIYIEEYMEPGEQSSANKTSSQESFTNFVYTEVHQPLNEEGIASVSNAEEIPFIDDGSPTEEEETPYVPTEQFQQLNRGIIGNKKPLHMNTQRKTVSFDLEEIASKESAVEILTNRKFHTHDALSKYCLNTSSSSNHNSNESLKQDSNSSLDNQGKMSLIQKIRRELNSYRPTTGTGTNNAVEADSGGSNSNSQRSSSESIERMPLLTQRFREVTIKPKRELNSIRSTSGGGINAGQQSFKYQLHQNRFLSHSQFRRDFSKPLPQMHHSIVKTQDVNIFSNLKNERKLSLNPIQNQPEYVPTSLQKPKSLSQNNLLSSDSSNEMPEFSKSWGEGKVKEMADFFAKNKDFKLQPFPNQKIFSKSTSDLMETKKAEPKKPLLTEPEQTDILKQLKEWSIFGLEGRDFDINLKTSQIPEEQQSFKKETQQRISFNANLINNINNNCSHINNNSDNYLKQCTNSVIETSSTPCKLSLCTKLNVNCDPCSCIETKNCCNLETCTLLKQHEPQCQHATCIKTNDCCKCYIHKSNCNYTTSTSPSCNQIQQKPTTTAKPLQRSGTLKLSSKAKTVRSIKRKQQQHNNHQNPAENNYKPFNSSSPSCKVLLSLASSDSLTTSSQSSTSNSSNLCSSTCPHCCSEFENHYDYSDAIKDDDTDDDNVVDDHDGLEAGSINEDIAVNDTNFHHDLDLNKTS